MTATDTNDSGRCENCGGELEQVDVDIVRAIADVWMEDDASLTRCTDCGRATFDGREILAPESERNRRQRETDK